LLTTYPGELVSLATQARPERTALGVFLIVSSVFLMSIQEALFKSFGADLYFTAGLYPARAANFSRFIQCVFTNSGAR
jgi:hypothetical protein